MTTPNSRVHRPVVAVAFAMAISLLSSGCVIVAGNGRAGDITFLWSFNGQSCMFVPQVQSVRVTIPGATLQNNGVYPCFTQGVAGITLLNFRGGTYTYTVEGLDAAGRQLYLATGQLVVNGSVTESVNLVPQQGAPSSALISWLLPQNLRCNQLGDVANNRTATKVLLSVDGQAVQEVDCNAGNLSGNPSASVQLNNLIGGVHQIDLRAADATNFVYARATNQFTTTVGGAVSVQFQLNWVVGSLPLQWQFFQGVVISCAQAQVANVFINFRNQQTNAWVYADQSGAPTSGAQLPCVNAGGRQGVVFPFLDAGNYEVSVQGPVTGNAYVYNTNRSTTVPVVQVQAGVFAQSETMGQTVQLQ